MQGTPIKRHIRSIISCRLWGALVAISGCFCLLGGRSSRDEKRRATTNSSKKREGLRLVTSYQEGLLWIIQRSLQHLQTLRSIDIKAHANLCTYIHYILLPTLH